MLHRFSNSWRLQSQNLAYAIKIAPVLKSRKLCVHKYRTVLLTLACLLFLHLSTTYALGGSPVGQSDFESRLTEAVNAQSAGDFKTAIAAYQNALAIKHDVPEVWANLGLMQHQTADYKN